jgi:hypothetical protein
MSMVPVIVNGVIVDFIPIQPEDESTPKDPGPPDRTEWLLLALISVAMVIVLADVFAVIAATLLPASH